MKEATSVKSLPKRRVKLTDIIIGVVLVAVIIGLLVFLLQQMSLKQEVKTAKETTNRIVNDIRQVKAADALTLGTAAFRKNHSESQLTALFMAANKFAPGTPSIASQTVTNTKDSQNVGIVYKYGGTKNPYFIRVVTTKPHGVKSWQLVGVSGGNDQVKLETNK